MADVFTHIRDMLVFSLQADEASVSKCSRLVEDLGADSIDLYELAVECEEEFDIDIPNGELEKFVTVGDAVRFVELRVSASSPARILA